MADKSYVFQWKIESSHVQVNEMFFKPDAPGDCDFTVLLKIVRGTNLINDNYSVMFSKKLFANWSMTSSKSLRFDGDNNLFPANEWAGLFSNPVINESYSITLKVTINDDMIKQHQIQNKTCTDCFSHSRNRPSCVMDALDDLFRSMNLSDVKLLTSDQKEVKAHKNILASRSPVFKGMFTHDMLETKKNEVDMKEFNVTVVNELLSYIYTNRCPNIANVDEELLLAADMYDVDGLKYLCELSISDKVCKENSLRLLILAEMHECNFLCSFIKSFVTQNGGIHLITNQKEWKTLFTRPIQDSLQLKRDSLAGNSGDETE